jgi:hypothetical protein
MTWAATYPTVYRSLAPEYRALPAWQVEGVLTEVLGPGATLEYTEGFLDDIGKALKQVGRVIVKAAPGALAGAVGGAPAGLPGIIGGALLGGAGSVLGQPAAGGAIAAAGPTATPAAGPSPAAAATGAAGPAGTAAPPTAGGSAAGAPAGGAAAPAASGDAAAAILSLFKALSSPTTGDALAKMLLGPAGAKTVSTASGQEVARAAFTNMLSTLASGASAASVAPTAGRPADHLASSGLAETLDVANPEVRATWLYQQLAPPEDDDADLDDGWEDDMDDLLEAQLLELAADDDDELAERWPW